VAIHHVDDRNADVDHRMEFIMSNDNAKPASNPKDANQASERNQSAQPGRQTWIGGGSEPVHPDDIGADGQYIPADKSKEQGKLKPDAGNGNRQQ
jgi:hypothetical protein